jgi:hypothetical protein
MFHGLKRLARSMGSPGDATDVPERDGESAPK